MVIKKSSHLRSLIKAISWRIIATLDTILVVLLVTCIFEQCSIENAIKIGLLEFLLKLLIFYFHERLWLYFYNRQVKSNKEILYKTISWRFVATFTTFIISGIILEKYDEVVFLITFSEMFTKFALYYFHEKLWLKIPLGKIRRFYK